MRALFRIFISWLPLAIAITGICLMLYTGLYQVYRQTVNDVPIQMAEDVSTSLTAGVDELTFSGIIDMRYSIAPFVIVYNSRFVDMGGNGILDGLVPDAPEGILEDLGSWRWGRTWQPDEDIRVATVIVPFKTPEGQEGYVLAGRNMRLIDDHIRSMSTNIFSTWIVLLIGTFLAKGLSRYLS